MLISFKCFGDSKRLTSYFFIGWLLDAIMKASLAEALALVEVSKISRSERVELRARFPKSILFISGIDASAPEIVIIYLCSPSLENLCCLHSILYGLEFHTF